MNTYQVATFNGIGEEGYSIQKLVPVGDTVVGGGEVTLMTLKPSEGQAQTIYKRYSRKRYSQATAA